MFFKCKNYIFNDYNGERLIQFLNKNGIPRLNDILITYKINVCKHVCIDSMHAKKSNESFNK